MSDIGFFTAVKYVNQGQTCRQSLLTGVDDYFHLCGRKAQVLQGATRDGKEVVVLTNVRASRLAQVAKIITYFTIFIPLLMLLSKVILRLTHTFRVMDPKEKKLPVSIPVAIPPMPSLAAPSPAKAPSVIAPSPIVPSSVKPAVSYASFKDLDPNDPTTLADANVTALINKVESFFGRLNILCYRSYSSHGSAFRFASCIPVENQEITADPTRCLVINGKTTKHEHDKFNGFILAFEVNGSKFYYYLSENEQVDDTNKVVCFAPGQTEGVVMNAGSIFPKAALSTTLNKDKPGAEIEAIKQKLMGFVPPNCNILSFETFHGHANTEIKIANCVPGHTFQIANDPNRQLLMDGEPVGIRNVQANGYYFIFESNGKIYLYNKLENQPLGDDDKVLIIENGKISMSKAGDVFPSPKASKKASSIAPVEVLDLSDPKALLGNPVLEIKAKVETKNPPKVILSYETFTSTKNEKIKLANCTRHKIQIDDQNSLLVDGKPCFDLNEQDEYFFVYDDADNIYLYAKSKSAPLGDNDDFCIIKKDTRDISWKKSKDVFPSLPVQAKIAPSTVSLKPNDPVELGDIMDVIHKIEANTASNLTVQNLETFSVNGVKIRIANCTGNNIQIDEEYKLLVNGKCPIGGNNKSCCCVVYEDNDKLYIYFKNDDSSLGDRDDIADIDKATFALKMKKSLGMTSSKPAIVIPKKLSLNEASSDTYIQNIKAKVETKVPPQTILSYEKFDVKGVSIKVVNCVQGYEVVLDEESNLFVNGVSLLSENTIDAYYYFFEDKKNICIYIQGDKEQLSDTNDFCIIDKTLSKSDVVKAKDFFQPSMAIPPAAPALG